MTIHLLAESRGPKCIPWATSVRMCNKNNMAIIRNLYIDFNLNTSAEENIWV